MRARIWLLGLFALASASLATSACSSTSPGTPDRAGAERGLLADAGPGPEASAADVGKSDAPGPEITTLIGIWQVFGADARGTYQGQLELRDDGGKVSVYRVVRYTGGITVEDGRELWTAWTGSAAVSGLSATLTVSLQRADFVHSRGGVARTTADQTPLPVTGKLTASSSGVLVHWSGDGVAADDALSNLAPNGPSPIFQKDRTSSPANSAPDPTTLAALNALFASYQSLPAVQPYASNPAFKAGIYFVDVDRTDYDFYQSNPNALRVVDKVIDPPSLGETLARANAYRKTLAAKAALFDAETQQKFIEPATGQVVDSVFGGAQQPSGSGPLWTAAYVGSQAVGRRRAGRSHRAGSCAAARGAPTPSARSRPRTAAAPRAGRARAPEGPERPGGWDRGRASGRRAAAPPAD